MKKMSLVVGATFALMALAVVHSLAETSASRPSFAPPTAPTISAVESSSADQNRAASLFKSNHVVAVVPNSTDSQSSMWALMAGGLAFLLWRFRMSRTIS
jgi:hypothetical protein